MAVKCKHCLKPLSANHWTCCTGSRYLVNMKHLAPVSQVSFTVFNWTFIRCILSPTLISDVSENCVAHLRAFLTNVLATSAWIVAVTIFRNFQRRKCNRNALWKSCCRDAQANYSARATLSWQWCSALPSSYGLLLQRCRNCPRTQQLPCALSMLNSLATNQEESGSHDDGFSTACVCEKCPLSSVDVRCLDQQSNIAQQSAISTYNSVQRM